MFLRSFLLTSVMLLSCLVFLGQTGFPYDKEWKLVDSLMNKKNLPRSALVEVNKIYAAAKKDKQEAQWVKAIIYKNHLQEVDNRNISQNIFELENEITNAPPRIASILKSIEADQLNQYLQGHRYQLRDRTTIIGDTSSDINSWSGSRFKQRIRILYLSSLDNSRLLLQTPVEAFDPVLIKGNTRDLRPSLYDLLAWRALDYFQMEDPESASTNESLEENPVLFSEAPFFMQYGFSAVDSNSNQLTALRIYQQLLRFHAKDVLLDAWINADISRIQFVYQYAQIQEKDSLYMNALERITKQFPTLGVSSRAWYLEAQWWAVQAAYYDPLKDDLHRYDFLKSISICEQVLKNPDSSEGKSNCEQLLKNILRKDYSLKMEQVNIPDLPFRMLVTCKNINQLYGRIIRIDDATRESFDRNIYDLKFWPKLIHMPFVKSFQQTIPDTKDYQQHRVELKIDALAAGQYALLTSSDSSFSEKAIISLTSFFCSSIAFLQNGQDYFVVDRETGHALSGVKVKSYYQKHNAEYTYSPGKVYQSDLHGHFRLASEKTNSNNLKLEFYSGKDYLSSINYINYYRNDDAENIQRYQNKFEKAELRDYLFTDRSIYRPGQLVYFKGILVTRDFKTTKYKPVAQTKAKIFLMDVNDQNIDSLILISNDFGSFQGSFRLPQNLLNGEFSIRDAETSEEQTFSVEEYKRPSLYVEYDSVKGSYRVGDTIHLKGSALAYAGNPIDGGKLIWRVYRESRFPYPWLFRFYPSNSEQEIAHGESTTDESGKFDIRFIAIPDRSINKITKPVYSYRVEASVTDANGESRSATTNVSASYQSFEIISLLTVQSRVPKDSLDKISVTTRNAGGSFIKEKLTVSFYSLEAPSRLIRKRYWEQPDQFVISETDYIKEFPHDEYRNETEIKSWPMGPKVFEKTDSTNANGFFEIGRKALSSVRPGWYLFEFRASDLNGEEIVDKRYVQITGNGSESGYPGYNQIPVEEITSEPGKMITIQTGSDAKDLFVVRSRQVIADTATTFSFYTLNQQINSNSIEIKDADRGGFALTDAFVKNNRWYTSNHIIRVPWTNKELQISYGSWKDKTLPGSKESWKIKISGYKKDQSVAEILTSMYDASLDQFKFHSWTVPDLYPVYNGSNAWSGEKNFDDVNSSIRPVNGNQPIPFFRHEYDEIINFYFRNGVKFMGVMANAGGPEYKRRDLSGAVSEAVQLQDIAKFSPPKNVKDEEVEQVKSENANKNEVPGNIQIRKNFDETAFFQPDLKTDAQGNVEINFTMPEALTKWKWMVMANTKDLSFGYSEKAVVTQKELMVQTNMPRFFREGDSMLLPVKIANLSSRSMAGTVQLEWLNADNNQNTDQFIGNVKNSQPFNIKASQSGVVFFTATIPAHFNRPLLYRIVAKTNLKDAEYSDGEENIIPVLSNRMLVMESLPLNMDGKEEKHFVFEKLQKSNESASIQNQSLTIEYTTNPAWYAVQSLPYLMEFPYECAEQTFNRFYANALAKHIVQVSPIMQTIFEKWKNTDTAALLSNLQKNQELKSVLIRETPWVLESQSEADQRKNLALLFDMIKMRADLKSAFDKLQQMQSDDGGFPWFKGGRDDRYITQYIITGIGRLRKLKAIPDDLQALLNKMAKSGIAWLDKEINSDYERRDKSPALQNIDPIQIQYLYMRSFFPDVDVPGNIFNALNYYRKQASEKWIKQPVYLQGMIAMFLNRTGDIKTAKDILASLKENATNSPELGTYWKTVTNGYYWQEAPVETQSLLIEVFQELQAEKNAIDQMKYWLLQQKRTQHWPTTKATADACYALLLSGSDWISSQQSISMQLGNFMINSSDEKTEAGTGYFKKRIPGDQVVPAMGNIQVSVLRKPDSSANRQLSTVNRQLPTVNRQPPTVNPSWGAVYWQYFENLDKITSAQTQLSLTRNLFIERNSDKGPVLEAVSDKNVLKPGDKLKMRIIIKSDHDLEYVHLKDMRAACLEPVNVLSGYQWQGGLGYYETIQDVSTSFFFDRLPKGTYVFEYPVYVTTAGNFSNGISTLECMYAPEFAAHSEGIRVQVGSK